MEEMKTAVAQAAKVDVLKSLIKDVSNGVFSGKVWCTKHGVSSYFIQAAVNLGAIVPVNKVGKAIVYSPLLDETDTKALANIAKEMQAEIKSLYESRTQRAKKVVDVVKKPQLVSSEKTVYMPTPIPAFADMDVDTRERILNEIPVNAMVN